MGCVNSKDSSDDDNERNYIRTMTGAASESGFTDIAGSGVISEPIAASGKVVCYRTIPTTTPTTSATPSAKDLKRYPSSIHFLMQQATAVSGAMIQAELIEERIRKAKQEMRTITIRDGSLFIDYKYAGLVPPGMKVHI